YYDLIKQEIVDIKADGSFAHNMKYFTFDYGLRMTGSRFDRVFGHPHREQESPLEQFHKDMAASLQKITDEIVVGMATQIQRETGMQYLCMAGGVALNCVSNSQVMAKAGFKDI